MFDYVIFYIQNSYDLKNQLQKRKIHTDQLSSVVYKKNSVIISFFFQIFGEYKMFIWKKKIKKYNSKK